MDDFTSPLCGIMATDVVALVVFRGEEQRSPVSVQCVNDDGARFVGRVVLWGGGSFGRQAVCPAVSSMWDY